MSTILHVDPRQILDINASIRYATWAPAQIREHAEQFLTGDVKVAVLAEANEIEARLPELRAERARRLSHLPKTTKGHIA